MLSITLPEAGHEASFGEGGDSCRIYACVRGGFADVMFWNDYLKIYVSISSKSQNPSLDRQSSVAKTYDPVIRSSKRAEYNFTSKQFSLHSSSFSSFLFEPSQRIHPFVPTLCIAS